MEKKKRRQEEEEEEGKKSEANKEKKYEEEKKLHLVRNYQLRTRCPAHTLSGVLSGMQLIRSSSLSTGQLGGLRVVLVVVGSGVLVVSGSRRVISQR